MPSHGTGTPDATHADVTTGAGEPASRRPWAILAVVSMAQFMVLLDATVVNVALPRLEQDLHVTGSQLPWVLDAYTVTFGGLLLLGGRAADLIGRRRVFLGGLALFIGASLACGLASDATELVLARAAQGIGAGFLSPAALSIVTATFPKGPRRHTALGIWGGLGGLGATVGVVLGGLVVDSLGWPWAFFVNLPLGLTAGGLALWLVPRWLPAAGPHGRRRVDLPGAVVITFGLLLLVYATISVRQTAWTSSAAPWCAALAVLMLAMFVLIERRSPDPMVPRDVVHDRGLIVGSVGQFLVGATQLSAMFLISMQAQHELKMDPLHAGLSFVPMGAIAVCSALLASRLVKRLGLRATYVVGSGCGLCGLALFAQLSGAGSYPVAMLGPSLLVGIALPMGSVVGTIVGTSRADEARAGLASGILNASFQVGSALGLAVSATLAVTSLRYGYLAAAAFEVLSLVNAAVGFRFPAGGGVRTNSTPVTARRPEGVDGILSKGR
jgi:EmrB/QacA subfamily drug resistance transporter